MAIAYFGMKLVLICVEIDSDIDLSICFPYYKYIGFIRERRHLICKGKETFNVDAESRKQRYFSAFLYGQLIGMQRSHSRV